MGIPGHRFWSTQRYQVEIPSHWYSAAQLLKAATNKTCRVYCKGPSKPSVGRSERSQQSFAHVVRSQGRKIPCCLDDNSPTSINDLANATQVSSLGSACDRDDAPCCLPHWHRLFPGGILANASASSAWRFPCCCVSASSLAVSSRGSSASPNSCSAALWEV